VLLSVSPEGLIQTGSKNGLALGSNLSYLSLDQESNFSELCLDEGPEAEHGGAIR
jgi:hypothetical protein